MINSLIVSKPKERICRIDFYFEQMKKMGFNFTNLEKDPLKYNTPYKPDLQKKGRPRTHLTKIEIKPKWRSLPVTENVRKEIAARLKKLEKVFYYRRSYHFKSDDVSDDEDSDEGYSESGDEKEDSQAENLVETLNEVKNWIKDFEKNKKS